LFNPELNSEQNIVETREIVQQPPTKRAQLNGFREIADIKILLKQWVQYCGNEPPSAEDTEDLATFLGDLIHERDLVTVDQTLKYFRRLLCDNRGSEDMKKTYLDLALCVSQETVDTHGAPLYYRTDFD
jgi:hypothetical protein